MVSLAFIAFGDTGTILQSGKLPVLQVALSAFAVQDSDKTVGLSATGPSNLNWSIQSSTDLLDWAVLKEFFATNTVERVVDVTATNYARRFYRAEAW